MSKASAASGFRFKVNDFRFMPKPGGGPQANYLIKWTINTRAGGTRAGRGAKGHWKGCGGAWNE